MAGFIQNMLWNSVSGFVEEGKRTVGGFAGDALIKAGDMVEGGGRTVGNGIERKATSLGTSITGQTYKPAAKALPSTARRPAAHRSNSLPASTKPSTGGSGTPLGAKKYGTAASSTAKKSVNNLNKTTVGAIGGAKSTVGGVTRGVGGLSKPVDGVVGGTKNLAGGLASKPLNTANSAVKRSTSLPKPFPQSSPLPKTYGTPNAFPSGEKKTAVKPGQSKPFVPPAAQEKKQEARAGKKAYPGTNTLPGQGGRKPVGVSKSMYKPLQGYEPPVKTGEVKSFF
ncbi:hypothetical protein BU23DRAFT_548834 [Bimuria novae-zelandiae CBS 107.79]|uniref:Uncharacterized protein n=1 Tax=Bimuria novae-zelandiae CBS 107.79 TaxID=1447943 RepID=A0A6A5VRU3_9PLEO|nr:hypothetical protein BU23DRAFT_548834 [Bimuria novae-zelandiae CBS 107.79]